MWVKCSTPSDISSNFTVVSHIWSDSLEGTIGLGSCKLLFWKHKISKWRGQPVYKETVMHLCCLCTHTLNAFTRFFWLYHGNQETPSLHITLPVCACMCGRVHVSYIQLSIRILHWKLERGGEGCWCRGVDNLSSASLAHNNSASKIAFQPILQACICWFLIKNRSNVSHA